MKGMVIGIICRNYRAESYAVHASRVCRIRTYHYNDGYFGRLTWHVRHFDYRSDTQNCACAIWLTCNADSAVLHRRT